LPDPGGGKAKDKTMQSPQILAKLLALNTVNSKPNIDLMAYIKDLSEAAGAEVTLIFDPSGGKANLFATVGPQGGGGACVAHLVAGL
jgi:acetylornithine deacetylase